MAIFNLFENFFNKGSSPQDTNYLSLTLTPDRVLATIWALSDENVEVLGFAQKPFTNIDSLIHQAAVAIDSAGEQAKGDVSDVVFGLSTYWFENGEISQETSKILKTLSSELELKPQAFVPLSLAINHLLKVEESVTPYAVLVGVMGDYCEVHLIKNNTVLNSKLAKSAVSIGKIIELIKQVKTEDTLPARIIVYGIPKDSKLSEDILKADWKNLFIHEPKIDFLDSKALSKSVAYAQASDILGHDPSLRSVGPPKEDSTEKDNLGKEAKTNELGFVEDEDILKYKAKTEEEIASAISKEEPELESKETSEKEKKEYALDFDQDNKSNVSQSGIEDYKVADKKQKGFVEEITTLGYLTKIQNIFKKRPPAKKIVVGLAILFVLIFAGFFVAGQTLTKAEVTIKVNAKPYEKDFDASVIASGTPNAAKHQITGEEIVANASGSQKAVTTGTKKVGQKAKGAVIVRNWGTQDKSFPQNTELITNDGLKFTLDNDIRVASRSAGPGTTKVNSTADGIGQKYNLSTTSSLLTIVGFDSTFYDATIDTVFTGGDEKQVTVVSKEDTGKLEKSLLESLKEKTLTDLKSKISGKKTHDNTVFIDIVKKQFDKNLEQEASLVNLDMEINAKIIAYDEFRLKELLAETIKDEVPGNFEAKPENIEITNVDAKSSNEKLTLSGKFVANLVPKFNEEDLKSKISGKNQKEARSIIKEIPEVSDIAVKFSPNLFLTSTVPKDKTKIKFKVETTR